MRNRFITGLLLAASGATALIAQQPSLPRGDAARGKALYEGNQCADCHRLGQSGSRVGPDLSAVGDNRTPEQLGGTVASGPMTFAVAGKQYVAVAVAADNTLYVFGM